MASAAALLPIAAIGAAATAGFAAAIVLLDLAIYLQHVMLHAVPALWLVHRMHPGGTGCSALSGAAGGDAARVGGDGNQRGTFCC